MLSKKAQGLSMNVIIIAAIALIVLVVLVMIFTGRMGIFTGGVQTCTSQGGVCRPTDKTCDDIMQDLDGDPTTRDYTEETVETSDCPSGTCCIGVRR